MDSKISLTVNGRQHTITTDPQRSLLDVLREELKLTGTKYGCGEARCGACSVIIDGKRAFSCKTPLEQVADKKVETIEGLADGEKLHPVQEAFLAENAFQCGYCTPGMIMAAVALLREKPEPTNDDIVSALYRNVCRCCSYPKIMAAVKRAGAKKEEK